MKRWPADQYAHGPVRSACIADTPVTPRLPTLASVPHTPHCSPFPALKELHLQWDSTGALDWRSHMQEDP